MSQYQFRSQMKNQAKDIMVGKYSSTIFLFLVRGVFVLFINNLTLTINLQLSTSLANLFHIQTDNPVLIGLYYLISFVSTVLINVFNVGFSLYFLNTACGRMGSISNLFYGFQHDFLKSFSISGVIVFVNTICYAPMEIFTQTFSLEKGFDQPYMPTLLCAMLIGFVIRIPFSLGLSQCYFLMLDFPQYGIVKTIKQSFRIMNGYKGTLFLIELSFLPLTLLNMLSFGIGFLWLTPYMNMVYTLFFLSLMKNREASAQ